MTQDEAEREALKREQHKSKHLNHKRWAAVHSSTKGWHVALVHNHALLDQRAREKARAALARGDMAAFVEAASESLMAKVGAAIDATFAPVDTLPKGQDGEAGLVRSKGSAVPEGQAPKSSSESHP